MGGRDQIVRCTFSPTSRGGFGFYYAARGAELEFTVSHRQDEAEQADELVRQLHVGVERLTDVLGEWTAGCR